MTTKQISSSDLKIGDTFWAEDAWVTVTKHESYTVAPEDEPAFMAEHGITSFNMPVIVTVRIDERR